MIKLKKKLIKTLCFSAPVIGIIFLTACQPLTTKMQNISTSITPSIEKSTHMESATQNMEIETLPTTSLGSIYRLLIEAKHVPCDSPKPMQCMLVQVIQTEQANSSQQPIYTQLPYNAIAGFKSSKNIRYLIDARPIIDNQTTNPTGDWKLENILSQKSMATIR